MATDTKEQDQRHVMTEAHTPTPWAVCDTPPNDAWYAGLTIYCPAQEKRVGDTSPLDFRGKANAAFIVRAVNAHDDLVKALEKIVRLRDEKSDGLQNLRAANIARAALSRAKGAA